MYSDASYHKYINYVRDRNIRTKPSQLGFTIHSGRIWLFPSTKMPQQFPLAYLPNVS